MTDSPTPPLLITGEQLLLAIDILYGVFQPVDRIDGEEARRRCDELIFPSRPFATLRHLAYMYLQIDRDRTLRTVLSTASADNLRAITFDANALIQPLEEGRCWHGKQDLVCLFRAVADGTLSRADVQPRSVTP